MKTKIIELLTQINACHGPAGDEHAVADVLKRHTAPYADEVFTDTLGNLIAHKKGTGPKVMFSAHMDSIGLIVTHIEKEGFLRVGAVGGIPVADVLQTVVRFANGTRGIVSCSDDADRKKLKIDDLYLDIGASSAQEAGQLVKIGDVAVYDGPAFAAGTRIVSPYLDDRIACVVQILAMQSIKETDNDLWFVFSTQEEVGCRGAKTAAYGIAPDYGIAIDVTLTCDIPGSKHIGSTALGSGAGVKVMDRSVICSPRVVSLMEAMCKEHGIACQRDVLRAGGTDAGVMQATKLGALAGGISIPSRYTHAPAEMVDAGDVEACVRLVCAFAQAKLPQEL